MLCFLSDVLALATSINELTNHTRRARTAMWCALQTSLKDIPASSLHHLRPSELAAHDAANHQNANVASQTSNTPPQPSKDATQARSEENASAKEPTSQSESGTEVKTPVVLAANKGADDNNNAQPAAQGLIVDVQKQDAPLQVN